MDPTNDEQTELLRTIWKQMVTMGDGFNRRIDALDEKLTSRIDTLTKQTHDNFGRVQRNLDRVSLRLDDIEGRLTRVEEFCGLHPVR